MDDKRDEVLGSLLREGATRLSLTPSGADGARGEPGLQASGRPAGAIVSTFTQPALAVIAAALVVAVLAPSAISKGAQRRRVLDATTELALALLPDRAPLLAEAAYVEVAGELASLEALLEDLRSPAF